jgi:uncharacterized protein (DUF488 family)
MNSTSPIVYTIGHSNHTIEAFIALLKKHGITALADVRSAPYSRFQPQFNKDALERSLKAEGIKYVFLGKELGARSNDRSCYQSGRVRYPLLAKTVLFRKGLERVMAGAQDFKIAIMCAEKEPLECHRTLLVSRALEAEHATVQHVLADGHLESHTDAMFRLIDVVGLQREDMFRTPEEILAEALAMQEEKVAYVDEKLANDESSAA